MDSFQGISPETGPLEQPRKTENRVVPESTDMKWVREKANVDRIACPWVIKKFVDPEAVVMFVPANQVLKKAKEENAISFDAPGAELTHYEAEGKDYISLMRLSRNTGCKTQLCWS
jgi:hypothetical protein